MSRRDDRDRDRDFDPRRHRSRFNREPSPKKSRRDGKPETERVLRNGDVGDRGDKDQNQKQALQDVLPLEVAPAPDSKVRTGSMNKELEKKYNEQPGGTKYSSEPAEIPRSRSYFQHDKRGNAARDGRSYSRRAAHERGWWSSGKDPKDERGTKPCDTRQKDENPQSNGDGNGKWHHDKFPEREGDLPPQPPLPSPPTRKRPAFREKKILVEPENNHKEAKEPEKASQPDHSVLVNERRDEKERNPRHWEKHERLSGGDRVASRDGTLQGLYLSKDRHAGGGGGNYRGRDRFSGRQGYQPAGNRVEKWKHDLFDEANKTPPPRNEEEQIAKLEALLAS